MKKSNKVNAWAPRPRRIGVLPLLCWCAALIALAGVGFFFLSEEAEALPTDVVISEVMTANAAAWPTPDGAFYDWVELWNRSDRAVQLGGCRLADELDIRGGYLMPERELAPGERLVLYCTNAEDPGVLCTGFPLNKDGVTLALLDGNGGILDSVKVPALRKGEVYARGEESGEWTITNDFTPGFENTPAAHEQLRVEAAESGPVRISELMASNAGAIKDADGDPSDWIELHNESDQSVRLANWALVEGAGGGGKSWSFPDVTLDANGYLLVFASAKNRDEGELHTSFRLSASGETVYLLDESGRIASVAAYGPLGENVSLSRAQDGFTTSLAPSPGMENGASAPGAALSQNAESVYINEVMCSMSGGADWAELYNAGGASVDLSGWWLSDDASHPRKYAFPAGTSIAPGGYQVVILGSESEVANAQRNYPRADFALSLAGDSLALSRPDGSVADSVELTNQRANVSYGRAEGQASYRYFEQMTPGAANAGASYGAITGKVAFSVPGGRMTGEVTVELSAQSGAAIYYTTDGSDPGPSSARYAGPIGISSNTVLRAVAQADDAMASEVVSNTYVFDDAGDIRLVCVSGDPAALSGSGGVLNTGRKTKLGVGVEIYGADGAALISQNCELMISGHYTTKAEFPQKAFRLKAKKQYGEGKFRAKLFDDREYAEFDALVLRASGQDSRKAFMRDALLTSLAGELGLYHQDYEMCTVYVNGSYWGLYYLREHVDADSICHFEGWDPENTSVDLLEGNGLTELSGSRSNFQEMMSFVRSEGLASDENVERLRQWCDIENYLDYVAIQMFTEHEDLGNLRMYRNANGGKWRWVVFDLDLSFLNDKNNVSTWLSSEGKVGSITSQSNVLFYQLMRNDKMRDYFLTRMGQLLATTFSADHVSSMVEAQYQAIEAEMQRNTERWNWSFGTWQKRARTMYNYAKSRPMKLLGYLQKGFKLSDEQMQHYFADAIAVNTASAS